MAHYFSYYRLYDGHESCFQSTYPSSLKQHDDENKRDLDYLKVGVFYQKIYNTLFRQWIVLSLYYIAMV